jgi:hypothetical protein
VISLSLILWMEWNVLKIIFCSLFTATTLDTVICSFTSCDWLTEWMNHWLIDWPTDWLMNRLTDLTDWTTSVVSHLLFYRNVCIRSNLRVFTIGLCLPCQPVSLLDKYKRHTQDRQCDPAAPFPWQIPKMNALLLLLRSMV